MRSRSVCVRSGECDTLSVSVSAWSEYDQCRVWLYIGQKFSKKDVKSIISTLVHCLHCLHGYISAYVPKGTQDHLP